MKKLFLVCLGCSSLVALAQTLPKAVLFEVSGQSASVVAIFDSNKWLPTTQQIPEKKPLLGSNPNIKLLTDVGQIGTGQLVGAFKDGRCGSELVLSSKTVVSRMIYGLLAPWNIMPRKVLRLPLNNLVYNKVMADELAKRGIKAPVQMTQILKADLDGDKSDEIIMVAQRPALSANFDVVGTGYALKAHDYAVMV